MSEEVYNYVVSWTCIVCGAKVRPDVKLMIKYKFILNHEPAEGALVRCWGCRRHHKRSSRPRRPGFFSPYS